MIEQGSILPEAGEGTQEFVEVLQPLSRSDEPYQVTEKKMGLSTLFAIPNGGMDSVAQENNVWAIVDRSRKPGVTIEQERSAGVQQATALVKQGPNEFSDVTNQYHDACAMVAVTPEAGRLSLEVLRHKDSGAVVLDLCNLFPTNSQAKSFHPSGIGPAIMNVVGKEESRTSHHLSTEEQANHTLTILYSDGADSVMRYVITDAHRQWNRENPGTVPTAAQFQQLLCKHIKTRAQEQRRLDSDDPKKPRSYPTNDDATFLFIDGAALWIHHMKIGDMEKDVPQPAQAA